MTPSKETRRAEGRDQPGRIPGEREKGRTQSRTTLPSGLARVDAAACRAVQTRFTALLHHVDVEALERAFWRQTRRASAGVDVMAATLSEWRDAFLFQDAIASSVNHIVKLPRPRRLAS